MRFFSCGRFLDHSRVRSGLWSSLVLFLSFGLASLQVWGANAPKAVEPGWEPQDDCQPFSLLDPGESMERIPVRDQGNLGTCYAYAAAEAIDAWRFSSDPKEVGFFTSPHALAIAAKNSVSAKDRRKQIFDSEENPNVTPLDNHNFSEAIRTAEKQGICSYDVFGANIMDPANPFHGDQRRFWNEVKEDYQVLHNAYIQAALTFDRAKARRVLEDARALLGGVLCRAGFTDDQSRFVDEARLVNMIVAEDVYEALAHLSAQVCENRTKNLPPDFPGPPITLWKEEIPRRYQTIEARSVIFHRMIHAMFDFKKKQPIMINYCSNVLTDYGYVGLDIKTGVSRSCSGHASLLIGRRRGADGRCGFIMRNSWGSDRDSSKGSITNLDDQGNLWIPEDALYNNLREVAVLPPKGETYRPPTHLYEGLP